MATTQGRNPIATAILVLVGLGAAVFGWRYLEQRKGAVDALSTASTEQTSEANLPAAQPSEGTQPASASPPVGEPVATVYDTPVAPLNPPLSAREYKRLRQKIAQADHLAVESSLLDGQHIALRSVQALLNSDDFDKKFSQFEQEARADVLADELSRAIADQFAIRVAAAKLKMHAPEVSCGMRICLARIRGHVSKSDWDEFVAAWRNDPAAKSGASIARVIDRPGGGQELRLIFSTDPTSASFSVRQ